MTNHNHLNYLLAIGALAAAMVLGVAQPAHATLISLTVTLSDPDNFPGLGLPPTLSDTVQVIVPGREIFAGDAATNIGGAEVGGGTLLLAHEYVDARPTADAAAANRILLGLEAGVGDHTGYGPRAYYSFSNFVFATPSIVTGFTPSFMNFDPTSVSGQVTFDHGVVKVMVGSLVINAACDGRVACGTITLDLTVRAVPEPRTFALIGAGLVVVIVAAGRQRRRS